jgi:hypothetical protein
MMIYNRGIKEDSGKPDELLGKICDLIDKEQQ